MSDGGALSFSQAKALILKQRLSADEVKSLQTANCPVKGRPNPSPKLKKDGSTPLHISAYYRAKDLGIARQRSYLSQASQAALV